MSKWFWGCFSGCCIDIQSVGNWFNRMIFDIFATHLSPFGRIIAESRFPYTQTLGWRLNNGGNTTFFSADIDVIANIQDTRCYQSPMPLAIYWHCTYAFCLFRSLIRWVLHNSTLEQCRYCLNLLMPNLFVINNIYIKSSRTTIWIIEHL